ncbi:MAG: glycosyltransferase family 4 protein [Planctomycetes bacterium]|nr:glycosyltransferase family 4 protein [Planctomycetota bacterium]
MRDALSALFVSTYPPEQCGLATFTRNLADAVDATQTRPAASVAAINRTGRRNCYDHRVVCEINNTLDDCYQQAARFINASDVDVVCLQHEYGLYRGECGDQIVELLDLCDKPIVGTLHTILPAPSDKQREVLRAIAARCDRLVTMARVGIDLLEQVYGVPRDKAVMIPHGVPEVVFHHRPLLRRLLGLGGRTVIMTFGLLSGGKGIEYMIDALPAICARHPNTLYLVLGETHPAIREREGEAYRESLQERALRLGVGDHVRFENRYVTDDELVFYLQACDVYVTPYIGRDQITSGTLSYAMAAGCPTVSTGYLHARELLDEGRGRLAEFESGASLAAEINAILGDPAYREQLQVRAYEYGLSMHWDQVGRQYQRLLASVSGKPTSHEKPPPRMTLERLIEERRERQNAAVPSAPGD